MKFVATQTKEIWLRIFRRKNIAENAEILRKKKVIEIYTKFHTEKDILHELHLYGAELTEFGFPILPPIHADGVSKLKAVPFHEASREKNPRKSICHFYIDDYKFDYMWSNPEKYIPMLKNFKYVISTDFSAYDDMPLPLQYYQYFRDRVLAYYMIISGVKVIPNASFGGEKSWEFCFDGLPKNSTVAITTNEKYHDKRSSEVFLKGFDVMLNKLEPTKIICIGEPLEGMKTDGLNIIFMENAQKQWEQKGAKSNV